MKPKLATNAAIKTGGSRPGPRDYRVEQHQDQPDRQPNNHRQTARGPLLVLELSSVLDEVSRPQSDFAIDSRSNLRDEATQIAASDIRHHNDAPLALLPINQLRTPWHSAL
jgi:hypothetical protein